MLELVGRAGWGSVSSTCSSRRLTAGPELHSPLRSCRRGTEQVFAGYVTRSTAEVNALKYYERAFFRLLNQHFQWEQQNSKRGAALQKRGTLANTFLMRVDVCMHVEISQFFGGQPRKSSKHASEVPGS